MTRKIAMGAAAAFILGLAAFILVIETGSSVPVSSGPGLSDPRAGVELATSKVSRKLAGQMSQRKQRIKGVAKLDRPDLFAQYHVDIRTRHGEAAPSYPHNYKVDELLKAKKLHSTKALGKAISSNQLDWVERGPGNVSGRTRGLIVDPDDPQFNTWYAGSVGGGVWKTVDAGQTWLELTRDLPNLAVGWLAMAPSNHDVIYVGTGEGFGSFAFIFGSGIWKTTDRGLTWEQLASTANLEFQNVTRIIIDPADANTLLVTTSVGFRRAPTTSGIHRSIDGGLTWTKVFDSGPNPVEQIIANPDNFDTQYATVNTIGVIKSTNGGVTWVDASAGIGDVGRLEIAIAPSDPSILYLSVQGGTSGSVLYISVDAGANWVQGSDATGDIDWLGGQGWYDNTIAVSPYDATEVFVGGIDMWKINVGTGIDTTGFQVTGIDYENTQSFLSFQPFRTQDVANGIAFGSADQSDYTSIEVRFGPGKAQKAHRFLIPEGETSGVPAANYTYQDYVDIPFELWDSDNEVQLMVSFRDQTRNGVWELALFDDLTTREYVFLSAEPYDPSTPHPSMAMDGGHEHRQLYFIWPVLPAGGSFDPANLPEATLRINWGRFITTSITTSQVTDFTSFTGPTAPINVHVDHHNILMIPINAATNDFEILNANDGGVYHSEVRGDSWRNTLTGYNTTQFYGVDKKNGANEFIGGMQDNSTWRSPAGGSKCSRGAGL
ncbi:MAG: hypothetical protein IH971_10305 [Candidatus Marinimicrobia bacterium]|nr:hypothetical protein [Candidatus Neomarinimicrobiota bacterium]